MTDLPWPPPIAESPAGSGEDRGTDVAIVIVLYRSRPDIEAFAACLRAQSGVRFRVIAVDNASQDGAAEWIEQHGDTRWTMLRNTTNLGYAQACNQGLRLALADDTPIILMNTDIEFGPDFLARLLAAQQRHAADVLAPRVLHADGQRAWYAGGHFEYSWLLRNVHDTEEAPGAPEHRLVDFAPGCCLLLSPAILRRVGLLDERFHVYWEDADFCLRLKAKGCSIHYVREPSLIHAPGSSSGGEGTHAHARLFYRSYGAFLRKHRGIAYALAAVYRVWVDQRERDPARRAGPPSRMARAMVAGIFSRHGETTP